MSILKLSKLLKIFEEYTSKFSSHLKIASRLDVLREVERTFNNHEIYPPFMKEVELNIYEGDIDNGWVLKVQDDPRKYWLNGKEFDNLKEIIEEYKNKDEDKSDNDERDYYVFEENPYENFSDSYGPMSLEEAKELVVEKGKKTDEYTLLTVVYEDGIDKEGKPIWIIDSFWNNDQKNIIDWEDKEYNRYNPITGGSDMV